jgi:hypothetical protein
MVRFRQSMRHNEIKREALANPLTSSVGQADSLPLAQNRSLERQCSSNSFVINNDTAPI